MVSFFEILPQDRMGVSGFEYAPCRHVDEYTIVQCEANDAEFWSVYIRYETNDINSIDVEDCLADLETEEQAIEMVKMLESVKKTNNTILIF